MAKRKIDFRIDSKPPRKLSLSGKMSILFSGTLILVGCIVFWSTLIFCTLLIPDSGIEYLFSFDGSWINTEGIITGWDYTGASVNDYPVYQYWFEYSVDNISYSGTSYSTDLLVLEEVDTPCNVQYKSENFARAIIMDTNESIYGLIVLIVLLFPMAGALLIERGFKANSNFVKLLIKGIFTRGKMASYESTNVYINEENVYKYVFTFDVNGKSYKANTKTHLHSSVEDEEFELIIYNPENPEDNLVYDGHDHFPILNEAEGSLELNSSYTWVFVITSIGITINVIILLS